MQYTMLNDLGLRRDNQEDSIATATNEQGFSLFVLSDGVGGNKSGEVASNMISDYLTTQFKSTHFENSEEAFHFLSTTIEEINYSIYEKAQINQEMTGMSATVVACIIFHNQLLVAHVGDSRLYISQVSQIKQITTDHSYVQELINLGGITQEEAKNHPNKNIILRAVGSKPQVSIELTQKLLHLGDYILLCSDGLSDLVDEDDLLIQLNQKDTLENIANNLVSLANQRGGFDNISIILIKYE